MKKILGILAAMLISLPAAVLAVDIGAGIGIDMTTEDFLPLIWGCDSRVVMDDAVEPGRMTGPGAEMFERVENYAFEGEQVQWEVLVMDKNGIEKIEDVFVTVDGDIEVNCDQSGLTDISTCNARILEEEIKVFDADTMEMYTCTLTVETPDSMAGEMWVTAEVVDLDGQSNTMDENEYWFFNPVIALSVLGSLDFGTVRPGTISYSDTILVGNDAEMGSGVLMDMFISGTDFYDPISSGAKCPTSNRLKLGDQTLQGDDTEAVSTELQNKCEINLGSTETKDQICYFATNGAYDTQDDIRKDTEGYVPVVYGTAFTTAFYNDAEIIGTAATIDLNGISYFAGNVLSPGAEIAMTFKLGLPEPCNGDFSDGSLFFWGEAI